MENQEISKGDMKRERAADAARRKKMRRIILSVAAVLITAGLIFYGVPYIWQGPKDAPGESYVNQGQEHVALDYQFSYNSNPPTSGPHFASPANWGVYDYEVHDKLFIHNLEHGGIWIAYRPNMPVSVVEDLKGIAKEFGGSKIVMAPRSANDADIAIVAWTQALKFNLTRHDSGLIEEQKNQIRAFYKAYKNRGPEFVPDAMPGVDPKSVQ